MAVKRRSQLSDSDEEFRSRGSSELELSARPPAFISRRHSIDHSDIVIRTSTVRSELKKKQTADSADSRRVIRFQNDKMKEAWEKQQIEERRKEICSARSGKSEKQLKEPNEDEKSEESQVPVEVLKDNEADCESNEASDLHDARKDKNTYKEGQRGKKKRHHGSGKARSSHKQKREEKKPTSCPSKQDMHI